MSRIDFGYILRRLRHDRDETLDQVSSATGLSVAMLSRIERGERLPSPDSVEALAKHFDLSVDYLMNETIARRLVNRYGEESTNRAAEHLSREPIDLAPIAERLDEEDTAIAFGSREARPTARRQARAYGPFQEREILAALGSMPTPMPKTVGARAATDEGQAELDPATEQVLRAASQASEAAALLVRREAPGLSREARLALIDRISVLAGHATGILQMLAADPDRRVRDKAREALQRLSRL